MQFESVKVYADAGCQLEYKIQISSFCCIFYINHGDKQKLIFHKKTGKSQPTWQNKQWISTVRFNYMF